MKLFSCAPFLFVILIGCAAPTPTRAPAAPAVSAAANPTPPAAQKNNRVNDTQSYAFSQLIPFDGIPPVYDPQFASAAPAPLQDEELVLGVAWGGKAKAYSVSLLRFREMVNDELDGIPILVTW